MVLSTLLLGTGCGENVLVGNLQLRSLSDAGADIAEAVEVDAGPNRQGLKNSEGARKDAKKKAENGHPEDKDHSNN